MNGLIGLLIRAHEAAEKPLFYSWITHTALILEKTNSCHQVTDSLLKRRPWHMAKFPCIPDNVFLHTRPGFP